MTKIVIKTMGIPTPNKHHTLMSERPKMERGRKKNMRMRYMMANQRYFAVVLPSFLASMIGIFRIKGMGYQRRMPEMLKKRWQSAIWILFSSLSPELAMAASRPVAVVPMLEPRVNGYIRSRVMTPTPTSGVRAEVKTELLWTKKVMPAPTRMAAYPVR